MWNNLPDFTVNIEFTYLLMENLKYVYNLELIFFFFTLDYIIYSFVCNNIYNTQVKKILTTNFILFYYL